MIEQLLSSKLAQGSKAFSTSQLKINEYLLVIQPHEDLYNKLLEIKTNVAANYKCPQALHIKPSIAILKFMQIEMLEEKLVQNIKQTVASINPFMITLNGFGSLPTHTLFIKVSSSNCLTELTKQLKSIQSVLQYSKDVKPHFITEPHIIIAKKLLHWQYEQAWKQFNQQNYTAKCLVNKLVLLKKQVALGYDTITEIPMCNTLIKPAIQTTLFT
jgi:2'-5' RNA ligase